jgi:predicted nuclease with RNAse H fold
VLALGIDVSVSRGQDWVLLDRGPEVVDTGRIKAQPDQVRRLLDEHRPDVVAIDSPPAWGTVERSRLAERRLARIGIQSFGTPSDPRKGQNPFYAWMKVGFALFEAMADRYPRYRRGSVRGTAIEVFPHATAVTLAGCLPPRGLSKVAWRRQVLGSRGIASPALRSLDLVDAALAAVTGLEALRGRFAAVGEPDEGVIVLPVRILPTIRFRRCPEPTEQEAQPRLPGTSPCACGDPGCTALTRREFAPGHDAKRKSALWNVARRGHEATAELRRRGWELPPEMR